MQNSNNDEKIGKTIVRVRWYIFMLKIIVVVSIISLIFLYFLEKPLWIAPIIGVVACVLYRLIWIVICLILGKISRL